MNGATLFSGFEGVGVGMKAAGVRHLYGIEYDNAIADVARKNGFHTITADILECNPADFERPDILHASPPCPNFSNAKAGAEETPHDMALAAKVAEFVTVLLPDFFTLENVYQYRTSRSWQTIARALLEHGYSFNYWHVNSANYGTIRLCPIHHVLENTRKNVHGVEEYLNHASKMKIAGDIVHQSATMPKDAQARILAWDAAVGLVQRMPKGIVGNATPAKLVSRLRQISGEKTTPCGKVDELLTSEGILKLKEMGDISENTVSLLKICLAESSIQERLFTMSMETQQITALKILKCLQATENIYQDITSNQQSQMAGDRAKSGIDCPLCKFDGVPQTRKRMIAIARRDGIRPMLPEATHAKEPQAGLFGTKRRWVGWYEAIEDLIPGLPDSEFADWQLKKLPKEFIGHFAPHTQANSHTDGKFGGEPMTTIASTKYPDRAFIMNESNPNSNERRKYRNDDEPIKTITSGGMVKRAFVPSDRLECGHCGHEWTGMDRYTCPNCNRPDVGFIVDGQNAGRDITVLDKDSPLFSLPANNKGAYRASVGRVVKMTPRALARFQSFPDWYELPAKASLATRGIGNAVPPLLYQRIAESLT